MWYARTSYSTLAGKILFARLLESIQARRTKLSCDPYYRRWWSAKFYWEFSVDNRRFVARVNGFLLYLFIAAGSSDCRDHPLCTLELRASKRSLCKNDQISKHFEEVSVLDAAHFSPDQVRRSWLDQNVSHSLSWGAKSLQAEPGHVVEDRLVRANKMGPFPIQEHHMRFTESQTDATNATKVYC